VKLGVLFSGGKDSVFATYRAMQRNQVACLITLISQNPDSYMFHTPNLHVVALQAKASGIPLVARQSSGREDEELQDLALAIREAREKYRIDGVVTGALQSVYQSSRVQRTCRDLGLWCFNPLWYADPGSYMETLISSGFRAIVSAVGSEPFDPSWLGRSLDLSALLDLREYAEKYGTSLTGEGGEYETLVLDAPFFRQSIVIEEAETCWRNYRGVLRVARARLEEK